uniref:Uncharacterized protein n=1 Tax=Glossina austeni TaxID=7395 RepID=A0A1A9UQ31_GLOAU
MPESRLIADGAVIGWGLILFVTKRAEGDEFTLEPLLLAIAVAGGLLRLALANVRHNDGEGAVEIEEMAIDEAVEGMVEAFVLLMAKFVEAGWLTDVCPICDTVLHKDPKADFSKHELLALLTSVGFAMVGGKTPKIF